MVREVTFYTEKDQTPTKYTANDILAFQSGSRSFIAYRTNNNMAVFGKILNRGTLDLVSTVEKTGLTFFLKNNITGKSAILKRSESAKNDRFLIVQEMLDVANLPKNALRQKRIPFKQNTLVKFVSSYNAKSNPQSAWVYQGQINHHHVFAYAIAQRFDSNGTSGYMLSYSYGGENRDLDRHGFRLYSFRLQSIQEDQKISGTNGTFETKRTSIQLLPIGYRYAPGIGRVKPYMTFQAGFAINSFSEYEDFPRLTPKTVVKLNPDISLGFGMSFVISKSALDLEISADFTGYRFGMAVDF